MKKSIITRCVLFISVVLIHCLYLFCFGCAENADTYEQEVKARLEMMQRDQKEHGDEVISNYARASDYAGAYFELSYEKFMNIRNNTDEFDYISIWYRDEIDFYEEGDKCCTRVLSIDAGYEVVAQYMSSIDSYRVNYGELYCPPEENISFETSCNPDLVNDIYNYIGHEDNRDYFFSGDEFDGLTQPYLSPGIPMKIDNYIFFLSFGNPTAETDRPWVISKCIDEPDDIWNGLITLLEDNFINQFE